MKLNTVNLGWYQIIGGAIGIVTILLSLTTIDLEWPNALVFLPAIILWSFSIITGLSCLKESNNAIKLTKLCQAFQIFWFAILGYAFSFCSGIYLNVGLDVTESFNLTSGIGISKYELMINKEKENAFVSINLIPICILYLIDKGVTAKNAKETTV
ncbi:MAG: hypothetical protein WBP58_10770 [Chitinophagaceae bacterium]